MELDTLITSEKSLELYYVDITKDINPSIYEQCLKLIPAEKLKRLNRFRFEEDKKRSLYGEVMARCLFMDRLHITNEELVIVTNDYGKPQFENISSLHYNISHSGRYVICGICDEEIGVDVEEIKSFHKDIAARFFTKDEYSSLYKLEEEEAKTQFYIYWTLKESYIKYRGKGLSIPLNSFSIESSDEHYKVVSDQEEVHLFSQALDRNYMLGAAYRDCDRKVSIKEFDLQERVAR